MPSRSSCSAARMPSQVLAILMRMRSRPMPGLLVHADQLARLGQRSLGVEAQAGIDLGGHPAGDDLEDLAAEVDQQLVHERLGAVGPVARATAMAYCRASSTRCCVLRLLGRLVEQRRVGRRILRLVLGDGLDVAGVGHDRRVALQRFEQVHGDAFVWFKVRRNVVSAGIRLPCESALGRWPPDVPGAGKPSRPRRRRADGGGDLLGRLRRRGQRRSDFALQRQHRRGRLLAGLDAGLVVGVDADQAGVQADGALEERDQPAHRPGIDARNRDGHRLAVVLEQRRRACRAGSRAGSRRP